MKSFPKHFMVAIGLFVVAALVGGGLWFWTSGKLNDGLEQKRQLEMQLKTISGKGIFPSQKNLETIKASTEEITELIDPVENSIKKTSKLFDPVRGNAKPDGSFQGLPANEWKRLLGEKRDEILALAAANNVTLPEVFYMGFERYRALSPAEEATYHLGIQLMAIHELMKMTLLSGAVEFNEVNRVFAEDQANAIGGDGLAAVLASGPKDWYTIYPFELKFNGVAVSVTELVNQISSSPYFFVIRSVDVENEKTSVPRKTEVKGQATGEGALKNIIPIVGQENIKVSIRVDLILWNIPEEATPGAVKEEQK